MAWRHLLFFLALFLAQAHCAFARVAPGVDVFFAEGVAAQLKGKRIALLTNHTGVDSAQKPTLQLFLERSGDYEIAAFFSPEHGLQGQHYAFESVRHSEEKGVPVYSLHGETRRPRPEMLKGIDVVIYDIQCTGVRAYTYPTTLFYMMEEAAK